MRVSSLLSVILDRGLAVVDRLNRARDKEDLPFGELERDKSPESVVDLGVKSEGLAGRNDRIELEADVSDGSSVVGDLVFRTSSGGNEVVLGG